MKRLNLPEYTSIQSYNLCVASVLDLSLKDRLNSISGFIEQVSETYINLARVGSVHSIPPLIHPRGEDPIVISGVRKSELVKLYGYYMVDRQPGRGLYDLILVAAKEQCPFCGGIGRPKSLDHYLPKANYPQYAVLPQNLVPCCRDCNTEKSNALAAAEDEQAIHPYFDDDKFFSEQWVFATVNPTRPCSLEYFTEPPNDWSDIEKSRALNHFRDFNIGSRYSIQAADELSGLVDLRRGYLANVSAEEFSSYLASVSSSASYFPNHWKKVMYQALAKDSNFCGLPL
ncbi:HNH endonuclease [Pseudomonas sp. EA_105y_Pfl2_R69]|uniref:HNH endonuclease n=1 Tax=Pseudomonas sp. EA_105y_Pfl2_R69 TaxID=3088683 RepID=UPI0030DDC1D5